MRDPLPCYPIVGAQGVHLQLDDGRHLLDGMSSWWSAIHGYNHPSLNKAAKTQIDKMAHVMFGGIAHQPAAELGTRLLKLLPNAFQHIFLADSGSISIEVALKMASQYWQSAGKPEKQKFLTVRGGYHGDPFTCMSVSDPDNSQHHLFPSAIAKHFFADRPQTKFHGQWEPDDISSLKNCLETHHQEIAAIIIEPVVQGAGGMHFYHPEYCRSLRKLCDEYDVLLIFDEIATGFGRTGKMFAFEHTQIIPDIICVGKALTGGMMTLAATLTTTDVAATISNGKVPALMHGPTFMGNPLACAIACASLDLLTGDSDYNLYTDGIIREVLRIETGLHSLLEIQDHHSVADVRILGAIGVVEMHQPVDVALFQRSFVKKGTWVRPFGKLIYIMPPYITDNDHINLLCRSIIESISEIL